MIIFLRTSNQKGHLLNKISPASHTTIIKENHQKAGLGVYYRLEVCIHLPTPTPKFIR